MPPSTRSSRRYRRLVANLRTQRHPCYLCGNPIDYTLQYPHRQAFQAHHKKPWATHPDLRFDPANLVASHAVCNQAVASTESLLRDVRPLGQPSRDW